MRKIIAITTIRSDYDLMSPLYRLLHDDADIDFRLLVAGAHVSPVFGCTVQQIEADGFDILARVETLFDSDSKASRLNSASLLLHNALPIVAEFSPEGIMYAGDREDVIVGALLGGYLEIPTLHFYGGDHAADGYIDNPVRHATSKLSTAHFVACEMHRKRLIHMGESDKRIHVIGNISLDRIAGFTPLSRASLEQRFGRILDFDRYALVIHHPISQERATAPTQLRNIVDALETRGLKAFIGYPNSDPGNLAIRNTIDAFEKEGHIVYKNLPRDIFLSIYTNAAFIIGNSSSGICEAASFPVPAINVGLRQTGRHGDANVVFCEPTPEALVKAIDRVLSPEFMRSLRNVKNSYGDGRSARRAYEIIRNTDFLPMLFKREDPLSKE